jgi:hypothetical protein
MNGAGADFHATNGYGGMMGGAYMKKKDGEADAAAAAAEPVAEKAPEAESAAPADAHAKDEL